MPVASQHGHKAASSIKLPIFAKEIRLVVMDTVQCRGVWTLNPAVPITIITTIRHFFQH